MFKKIYCLLFSETTSQKGTFGALAILKDVFKGYPHSSLNSSHLISYYLLSLLVTPHFSLPCIEF